MSEVKVFKIRGDVTEEQMLNCCFGDKDDEDAQACVRYILRHGVAFERRDGGIARKHPFLDEPERGVPDYVRYYGLRPLVPVPGFIWSLLDAPEHILIEW